MALALMSSTRKEKGTQDNSIMVPRILNNHQLSDSKHSGERNVAVVYYLCRNGEVDHPHFIEVSLSSQHRLYLRDVIKRLNDLRGKGMASLYSWSSKRIYKNGFVWHDLSEEDVIFPFHGQDYILKGSQIIDIDNSGKDSDFPAITHRRNQTLSSIEYKIYKASESSRKLAMDASTQTDDSRKEEEEEASVNEITELSREEISPPPSDSSPETLETLMNADGRLILRPGEQKSNRTVEKMRPTAVLMQLISCGAMSFKKCGAALMSAPTECTVVRRTRNYRLEKAEKELMSFGRVNLEEKEYFSGSLIDQTKNEIVPALKKSSSCNTQRSSKMESKFVVYNKNKVKPPV